MNSGGGMQGALPDLVLGRSISHLPGPLVAVLTWGVLTWVGLTWVGLTWAVLTWAVLTWAVLTWAVLTWAVLTWAVLTWAVLTWIGGIMKSLASRRSLRIAAGILLGFLAGCVIATDSLAQVQGAPATSASMPRYAPGTLFQPASNFLLAVDLGKRVHSNVR